jgi:hypothetical protein
VRPKSYFTRFLTAMGDHARLYMGTCKGQTVCGAIAVNFSNKCCYVYGASDNVYRDAMPNYLMQWEMMRWALQTGCEVYDFQGISGNLSEENNPLYGLYRFKRGFPGEVVELVGEFELVYRPLLYRMFKKLPSPQGIPAPLPQKAIRMSTLKKALAAQIKSGKQRFHMPGHKGCLLPPLDTAAPYDVTELAETGSLWREKARSAASKKTFPPFTTVGPPCFQPAGAHFASRACWRFLQAGYTGDHGAQLPCCGRSRRCFAGSDTPVALARCPIGCGVFWQN